jgi:cytochrome c peroxidase
MTTKRGLLWAFICAAVLLLITFVATAAQSPDTGLTPNERLGKSIFFDLRLSFNENQACAACHGPDVGFTGPIEFFNAGGAVYEGSIAGRFGNRKPPSAAYATLSPILHYVIEKKEALFIGGNFWNGRATGEILGNPAADQALAPFVNPAEQALPDRACVVYKVCTATTYPVSFENYWGAGACDIAWPSDVDVACATEGDTVDLSPGDQAKVDENYGRIGLSIGAYEASPEVNAFTSKHDYSFKGMAKLTKEERRGFALFQGKGKCKLCHISNGQEALFTDFTYDNLGVPKNPENPVYDYDPEFVDWGLGGFLATRPDYEQFADENLGKQKVPTLRNVGKGSCEAEPDNPDCIVKAYTHNGYFKSLAGIVHFYNTRDVLPACPGDYTEAEALAADCWPEPEVAENVNRDELGDLGLTPDEEAAIVAFLDALSDGYTP